VLTANDNVTSVTVPHDIKPGNYIVRHELITLHFATAHSRYYDAAAKTKGAQHFITCFNIKFTGSGTSEPAGVTFPGGYKQGEPGIYFDLYRGAKEYPIPGPKLYVAEGAKPNLPENPFEMIMPVDNIVENIKYFNNMYVQAWKWDGQTFKRNNDSVHGSPDGPSERIKRNCTVEDPCVEDTDGSNPSWGPWDKS